MSFQKIILTVLLVTFGSVALAAEGAAPKPYIFFVQQDLRPVADTFDFAGGFSALMKSLPPDRPVRFVSFDSNGYQELLSAKAAEVAAPPPAYAMTMASNLSAPYKILLKFLQEKAVSDVTVYLVSNGNSKDLLPYADIPNPKTLKSGGGSDSSTDFLPTVSAPILRDVKEYCKKNRVRLVGFLVQKDAPTSGSHPLAIYRLAFVSTVSDTKGGKAFTDFMNFGKVFQSALKKYFQ